MPSREYWCQMVRVRTHHGEGFVRCWCWCFGVGGVVLVLVLMFVGAVGLCLGGVGVVGSAI